MKRCYHLVLSLAFSLCALSKTAFASELNQQQIAHIDGAVAALREAHTIPGLSVAVFDSSGSLFQRHYGFADADGQNSLQTLDPILPVASISKTFVAVALMRAVEQGLLQLHDAVNDHIDFELPTWPGARPISLRDLARHEAGLEERWLATGAGLKEDPRSWGEMLAQTFPLLIAPPGQYASYSNYGTSVLAYAIEQAAGIPYHEYLQREVLAPLGMQRTTSQHPAPELFNDKLAPGLRARGGVIRSAPPSFNLRTYPTGRVLTSLPDIVTYGSMLLNRGAAVDGTRILSEASIDELIADPKSVHPQMPGIGVVFAEKDIAGERFIGHGGDGGTHHTDLLLSEKHDIGIYLGFHSAPGPQAREWLARAIVPILIEGAGFQALPMPVSDQPPRFPEYAGSYRHYRWAYTSIERLLQLSSEFAIADSGAGTLIVKGRLGAGEYIPQDDEGLFVNRLTGELLYFWQDAAGNRNLNMGSFPFVTAYKLDSMDTQGTTQLLFYLINGVFALLIVFFIQNAYAAARTGGAVTATGPVILLLSSALAIFGMLGFMIGAASQSELALQSGIPGFADYFLAIPFVLLVLLAVYLWGVFKSRWRPTGIWGWILMLAFIGNFVLTLWFLNHWNALGWNYP